MIRPCEISDSLSAKMANMAFLCACTIPFLHVYCDFPAPCWGDRLYFWCRNIQTFAVPYFFVATGFFLVGHVQSPGWWRQAVRKRLMSLGVPYLVWNFLAWFSLFAIELAAGFVGLSFEGVANIGQGIMVFVNGVGLNLGMPPALVHLWYVRAIFLYLALTPFIFFVVRRFRLVGLTLLMAPYLFRIVCGVPDAWSYCLDYGFSLRGLFYLSLGVYLRLFPLKWCTKGRVIQVLCLLAFGISLTGFGGAVSLVQQLAMLCAVWFLVPASSWPRWLTSCAFPIYTLHWFTGLFSTIAVSALGLKEVAAESFACYLVLVLFDLIGALILALLMRRFLPKFYRVAFGGR